MDIRVNYKIKPYIEKNSHTYTVRTICTKKQKARQIHKAISVTGIIVAAEDGDPMVQEYQSEDEEERDTDRGARNAVDGIWFAGGENGGDEGATIGGEELNGEKKDNGEEEEAEWAKQLRDGFGEGFAAEEERPYNDQGYHNG
ncbi:hypothetical protein L6164_025442 [Bauhinia variegata]|uniref:Uncharacterized protein n=1 Tax=Bauhinia variegata TaxID=167791 RepID=A0ACB9M380_BAUVA|nr:hypothetical protein L6164_025442 [Bauhinia variegata]